MIDGMPTVASATMLGLLGRRNEEERRFDLVKAVYAQPAGF
jgi:hypothetical protein